MTTTTIQWHPDDANLMSFAAGSLAEPLAAAIAAHVAMCPRCRREMDLLRALGGACLETLPQATAGGAVELPARPDENPAGAASLARATMGGGAMPAPIVARYGVTLETVPWRWLAPGVWYHPLPLSAGATGDLRLLKIAAGRAMPEHGHGGSELTLVLQGAYRDETGAFRRGDIQDADGDLEHQPVVEAGAECICLVASERPARFRGPVGRLVQRWTGM